MIVGSRRLRERRRISGGATAQLVRPQGREPLGARGVGDARQRRSGLPRRAEDVRSGWPAEQGVELVLLDAPPGHYWRTADRTRTWTRCCCDVTAVRPWACVPGRVAALARRPGPVIVPFGGAEHDWAALELGAWVSAATEAPLKLLGAAGETDDRARPRACSATPA